MPQESSQRRMLESLCEDLAAPAWRFWIDKDGAAERLLELGHAARPVMTRIAGLVVDDTRQEVRAAAAYALRGILIPFSMAGEEDATTWIEADAQVRKMRQQIDEAYAHPTPSEAMRHAIEGLTRALRDEDEKVRKYALTALTFAGPHARESTSLVAPLCRDDNEEIQLLARACIANMTRGNGDTLHYIADKMLDESSDHALREVASRAMMVLYGIDRRPVVPKLLKAIRLCEPAISGKAITTVQTLLCSAPVGSFDGSSVVSALFSALECQPLAGGAAGALFYIGPAIVPELISAVRDHPDRTIRLYAARALGEIGPPAKRASKVLRGVADDLDDPDIVSEAFPSILTLGLKSPKIRRSTHGLPLVKDQSQSLTAVARTFNRTSSSPGCGLDTSSSRSTSGDPNRVRTIAFMTFANQRQERRW